MYKLNEGTGELNINRVIVNFPRTRFIWNRKHFFIKYLMVQFKWFLRLLTEIIVAFHDLKISRTSEYGFEFKRRKIK